MPESIYTHEAKGPQTVKVTAPDLPVIATASVKTEFLEVHVKAKDESSSIEISHALLLGRPSPVTVNVNRPASRRWNPFRRNGSSVRQSVVHASGRGSIVAGGSIQGCAIGNGSVVQVGGSTGETKEHGVHITLPAGSRLIVESDSDTTVWGAHLLKQISCAGSLKADRL